ncbi:MAG: hypothetical protein N0E48_27710, partial [Candidatus Thiodiazotropha endolucinida]|nr:hypothetical protein [Candidatus Thiodiazotropha taylori]MCW4347107.1 hypothetical protein [Candidatus Thiodiazotropha endolucinida]
SHLHHKIQIVDTRYKRLDEAVLKCIPSPHSEQKINNKYHNFTSEEFDICVLARTKGNKISKQNQQYAFSLFPKFMMEDQCELIETRHERTRPSSEQVPRQSVCACAQADPYDRPCTPPIGPSPDTTRV